MPPAAKRKARAGEGRRDGGADKGGEAYFLRRMEACLRKTVPSPDIYGKIESTGHLSFA
jgi:hypothetical protein